MAEPRPVTVPLKPGHSRTRDVLHDGGNCSLRIQPCAASSLGGKLDASASAVMQLILHNTSLTRLDFSENDVTAMRERYVNDSCKANRELLSCRDRPRHYLYNEQRGITRKHLLKKIHHLDKAKLRQLLANPTFTNDKLMHRRLLELVPPDRHKLVFRCVRVWRRENRVRERKQLGGEGRREYLFGRV